MEIDNYDIKPWVQYKLPDNGIYAPKGSNPTFHTESNCFQHDCNPIHPFVKGYIMHDQMDSEQLVPVRKIFVHEILNQLNQ